MALRAMVESTQWALLMPVLLGAVFGLTQGAVCWVGRSGAQQAAMAGAERATLVGIHNGQAQQVAIRVAQDAGLRSVNVTFKESTTGIEVQVSAHVTSALPSDWTMVQASAYREKER